MVCRACLGFLCLFRVWVCVGAKSSRWTYPFGGVEGVSLVGVWARWVLMVPSIWWGLLAWWGCVAWGVPMPWAVLVPMPRAVVGVINGIFSCEAGGGLLESSMWGNFLNWWAWGVPVLSTIGVVSVCGDFVIHKLVCRRSWCVPMETCWCVFFVDLACGVPVAVVCGLPLLCCLWGNVWVVPVGTAVVEGVGSIFTRKIVDETTEVVVCEVAATL